MNVLMIFFTLDRYGFINRHTDMNTLESNA